MADFEKNDGRLGKIIGKCSNEEYKCSKQITGKLSKGMNWDVT